MGVYYAIVNHTKKEYIYDPNNMGVKWWPLFNPEHPMGRLVLFKIYSSWSKDKLELVNDSGDWWPANDNEWVDITEKSVAEYIDCFKEDGKDDYYLTGFK